MRGSGAALGAAGRELQHGPLLSSGPARANCSTRLRDGQGLACRTLHICQRVDGTWAGAGGNSSCARALFASGGLRPEEGLRRGQRAAVLGAAPGMLQRPPRRPGPSRVSAPAPDRVRRRPRSHGCPSHRCPAPHRRSGRAPSPRVIAEEAP